MTFLQSEWHSDAAALDPWSVAQWIDVSFTLGIQLDAIHVQEVADGHSTPECVSITTCYDELAEGVEAYTAQQQEQCITLI